ncbi:hypothetical protein A1O3_07805 [Capronia epimyces CBS 606.96]|uniref:Major facilitator superfamily (MFS) profile domain-containing protein n=1 Tax=Capronia epimyces CBS 606.96 TaxID=1182542 RepID=W9XRB4_9EURO|nr:uncharacterized protein A1O3_07805 [Capronia epimyces CBS 606.96]EXJ79526.1 hypothetical protein A1O3_07805 [Capronia epimyces CBS 606.96]
MAQNSLERVTSNKLGELEPHGKALESLGQTAGHDAVFQAQATMINQAIEDIGMGKYQWTLFGLAGYGWLCDQLWESSVSNALPEIANEFQPRRSGFLIVALMVGLILGASFWGLGCDLIGRRWAWNLSLLFACVFGLVAAGSNSWVTCCSLIALSGFGIGGNLPVDGTVFLEFLPGTHQYLLEILTVWWAAGQFIAAFASWGLLSHYSCSSDTPAGECRKADNMGWRYLFILMGGLTMIGFCVRFFVFRLYESPKYLVSLGKYEEAIDVLNKVAKYNGVTQSLTVEHLRAAEQNAESTDHRREHFKRAVAHLGPRGWNNIRVLWSTKKLALSFALVMLLWGMIGMANPIYNSLLPIYLQIHGAESGDSSTGTTYRNLLVTIVCSIPGTLLGGYLIGMKRIGRKGTLGFSLLLTGAFLFAFTTARTQGTILAFNCIISFTQYIMWGALYYYTPEVFPTFHRGTAVGLAASFNRVCGLAGTLITTYSGFTNVPLFLGASLWMAAGLLSFVLPFETRNKASL